MNATIEITGYGRTAAAEGRVSVAQTGTMAGPVAGRAVVALDSDDLETFRKLYRRSRRLRLDACGRKLHLSYGGATLAVIQLPEGVYCRRGDDPTATARLIGLLD